MNSLNDFSTVFWNEYYTWYKTYIDTSLTDNLETFKTNVLEDWKENSLKDSTALTVCELKYPLYESENYINENDLDPNDYFMLASTNQNREIWQTWLKGFDKIVNNINADQDALTLVAVGHYRMYEVLAGLSKSHWTETRLKSFYKSYLIDPEFDYDYYYGDVVELPVLESNDGDIFRGWFDENNNKIVTSLVSKDEVQAAEINEMVEKTFEGSLPAFIAAFTKHQKISEEEIDAVQQMIDRYRKGE